MNDNFIEFAKDRGQQFLVLIISTLSPNPHLLVDAEDAQKGRQQAENQPGMVFESFTQRGIN